MAPKTVEEGEEQEPKEELCCRADDSSLPRLLPQKANGDSDFFRGCLDRESLAGEIPITDDTVIHALEYESECTAERICRDSKELSSPDATPCEETKKEHQNSTRNSTITLGVEARHRGSSSDHRVPLQESEEDELEILAANMVNETPQSQLLAGIVAEKETSSTETTWPSPLSDSNVEHEVLSLPTSYEEIRTECLRTQAITIRVVTWNQEANVTPPAQEVASHLLPAQKFHVIAFGTQECENGIAKSILIQSKARWEGIVTEAVGADYTIIRSHTLQATHSIVFIHKAILPLVSNVDSVAIATGIGETLGNKGGIGVTFYIGSSSFCFVNAHLAAHPQAMERRTFEFAKISCGVAMANTSDNSKYSDDGDTVQVRNHDIHDNEDGEDKTDHVVGNATTTPSSPTEEKEELRTFTDTDTDTDTDINITTKNTETSNPLVDWFDYVFWSGDMNYRIHGTREIVDGLLTQNMHSALRNNDQLTLLMKFNPIFRGMGEGPLNFRPTYKFDPGQDTYDTSRKRRVPSWTDRILYKMSPNVHIRSYDSATEIRTSDHRPVYATFRVNNVRVGQHSECKCNHHNDNMFTDDGLLFQNQTRSQVCTVS